MYSKIGLTSYPITQLSNSPKGGFYMFEPVSKSRVSQAAIESIKAFNNLITVPPTSWYNSIFLSHKKKPQFQVENIKEVEKAPKVQF